MSALEFLKGSTELYIGSIKTYLSTSLFLGFFLAAGFGSTSSSVAGATLFLAIAVAALVSLTTGPVAAFVWYGVLAKAPRSLIDCLLYGLLSSGLPLSPILVEKKALIAGLIVWLIVGLVGGMLHWLMTAVGNYGE